MRTIVWYRGKDLRLSDHEPLHYACKRGEVIPLFVLDPFFFGSEAAAELPHRMQFLLDSLRSLANNIASRGSQLMVAVGRSVEVVPRLAELWKADEVVAHRWTEPFGRTRDARIERRLLGRFRLFEGETLAPPGSVLTADGRPFSVYTPFAKAFGRTIQVGDPLQPISALPPLPNLEVPAGLVTAVDGGAELPSLESLGLETNPRIQPGGERRALDRLRRFIEDRIDGYATDRDRLDLDGTSRLSADLKFGTLSIRHVWRAVENASANAEGRGKYLSELLWREFAHHCLWHRPTLLQQPFRKEFSTFPWQEAQGSEWQAWLSGHTGYPVVDAAARQLLQEGFVHNRARMIAASFLTKHLMIHYRAGEAHYLKYLTDGDWAQNNAGWQWSAGCGCDAQPYFRVFNPVTQGEKFDPDGAYVRKYVPELSKVEQRYLHKPWTAPGETLRKAGVALGVNYPHPIVEHDFARKRFLSIAEGYMRTRKAAPSEMTR